jgi:F0F1-type ATP synthase assembly protein I
MTPSGLELGKGQAKPAFAVALLGVIGAVGCLTLGIIGTAIFAGLWLDNQFHTRPLFAIVLVLASMPVTLFLMFRIVMSLGPRFQEITDQVMQSEGEEYTESGELPGK